MKCCIGLGALVALLVVLPSASADTPAPGYSVSSAPTPAFASPMATLPGGDFVTFDGSTIDRWSPQGAFVMNLGTLPTFVFPSFAISSPTGATVVIGESSNQQIFSVATNGSGMTPLATLSFNYDAAFSPSGQLYVSAATGNFGPGNDIYRVAIPGGALTHVAHLAGPSGPIRFDAAGTLYYATQWGGGFPPPPGSTDVLAWNAAAVAAGGLDESNATLVCSALDGGASLAVDPSTQKLYIAETNFGLSTNFVRRVGSVQADSPIVVDAGTLSIYGLQFLPGATSATFDAFQPDTGVRLVYGATDFFSASQRSIVAPARPQLALSGPGLSGPGTLTLSLSGGVPNGCAYLLYCQQSLLLPGELAYVYPGFLFHTKFFLPRTKRLPFLLPADANGNSVLQIYNPGSLQGLHAYQFLVGTSAGAFVGSSNSAQF